MEDNDVIHIGAVANIFVSLLVLLAFQALACANETFLLVDIEFLVVCGYSHSGDIVEVSNLSLSAATLTVFLLDVQEIVNGVVHDMVEVVMRLFHPFFELGQLLVGLLDIKFGDLADWFLAELFYILAGNLAFQQLAVLVEASFNSSKLIVPSLVILVFQFLIDTFLEENLLQRHPMPAILQLVNQDTKFKTEEFHCAVSA